MTAIQDRQQDAAARQRRGTRQLLLGRAWFVLTGYVVAVVLARALEPADYGVYGVLVSLVSWLVIATSAGVPGATSQLLAEHSDDAPSVERSARFLLLTLAATIFAAAWLAAPLVAEFFRLPGGAALFRIAILDLPFVTIYAGYHGILGGHRRFGVLAGAQALYGTVKLGGVLTLAAVGMSLDRVLLVNAFATAVVCAILANRYPVWGRAKPATVRRLALIALPMGVYFIAGQVLVSLDLWSLKRLWQGTPDVVGQYVAALQLSKTLLVIPTVQSGVLLASTAWALAARDAVGARRHIHEATRFALLVAAPAAALLGADASTLLATLFSRPYGAGGPFLVLQLVGFALFALLDVFCVALVAAGRQWLAAGALLATLPVVVLANALLIPRFGGVGAAASLVAGVALAAIGTAILAYRRFGSLVEIPTLSRVLGAAAVVGVLARLIDTGAAWVFPKLAALGALYLGILVATGEVTRADFDFTRKRPA